MKPAALVVEDDPVTALFFEGVLSQAGYAVDLAGTAADAEALVVRAPHAAWLVDAHLPDGDATACLARLRAAVGPASGAQAIAHTASRDPALHARLRAAGYADVLAKPCTADALRACVARTLRPGVREPRADWDDQVAARAIGDAACMATLRARFVAELPGEVATIAAAAAAGDARALADTLHRLSAACAFAGATALGKAVRTLQARPGDAGALRALLDAARAVASASPPRAGPRT